MINFTYIKEEKAYLNLHYGKVSDLLKLIDSVKQYFGETEDLTYEFEPTRIIIKKTEKSVKEVSND